MSTRLTRADIIEVPLGTGDGDGVCMPLVVQQPSADLSNYMLKSVYATNGAPGVVDHAVLADNASTVVWDTITNLPSTFPPAKHAPSHLESGSDPIPRASTEASGLCPQGNGDSNSYLGGDSDWHTLTGVLEFRSEGDASISPGTPDGAAIYVGTIINPASGVYVIDQAYIYAVNEAYPPAGIVHFDVFDVALRGWVQVTESAEMAVLTSSNALLRPVLLSSAMTRVWAAGPNALNWRLVLEHQSGIQSYFRVGMAFMLTAISNPITPGPGGGPIA